MTLGTTIKCAFEGCRATTTRPMVDGWSYLAEWAPGIQDGYYCPAHRDALEQVLIEGGLDDPENDLGKEE